MTDDIYITREYTHVCIDVYLYNAYFGVVSC